MTTLNQTNRVLSIDIMRGFALLGIFFVNVPFMNVMTLGLHEGINPYIRLFYDIFIEAKFYVIFSLLFGASAYYFMRSQERKGLAYRKLFWIRAGWLYVFGMLHYHFIWQGDILHDYALVGFVLPFFYKVSPRKILVCAGIMLVLSFYINQFPVNLEYLSIALFGLGIAKLNFFGEFSRYKNTMKKIAMIAFLLSLPIIMIMIKDFINDTYFTSQIYIWLSGKLLAIVYITLILCACESEHIRKKLSPLAAYGKMAFTNYLMQSIVTILIVSPLMPGMTLVTQSLYCAVFLTIQVYVSTIIMKKYKYGPFEFVWRKLVFGVK